MSWSSKSNLSTNDKLYLYIDDRVNDVAAHGDFDSELHYFNSSDCVIDAEQIRKGEEILSVYRDKYHQVWSELRKTTFTGNHGLRYIPEEECRKTGHTLARNTIENDPQYRDYSSIINVDKETMQDLRAIHQATEDNSSNHSISSLVVSILPTSSSWSTGKEKVIDSKGYIKPSNDPSTFQERKETVQSCLKEYREKSLGNPDLVVAHNTIKKFPSCALAKIRQESMEKLPWLLDLTPDGQLASADNLDAGSYSLSWGSGSASGQLSPDTATFTWASVVEHSQWQKDW